MSSLLQAILDRQQSLVAATKSQYGYSVPSFARDYAIVSKRAGVSYQDSLSQMAEVDEGKMRARFIVSTVTPDRQGDIVPPQACLALLENYRRNPVVFFGHQQIPLPIGSSSSPTGEFTFTPEEQRITSWCHFHGKTAESNQIFHLVAAKQLNCASIGFNPLEAERLPPPRRKGDYYETDEISGKRPMIGMPGWLFRLIDVIEWSIVSIPANSEAIAIGLSKGFINGDRISPIMRKALEPYAVPMSGAVRSEYSGGIVLKKTRAVGKSTVAALASQLVLKPKKHNRNTTWMKQLKTIQKLPGPRPQALDAMGIKAPFEIERPFDISDEPELPLTRMIDWVAKYLQVPVKKVFQMSVGVSNVKMGNFLTGLRTVLLNKQYSQEDVRKLHYNGGEMPPNYENIRLNSKTTDTFLVDGSAFYKGPMHLIVDHNRHWGGIDLTFYCALDNQEEVKNIIKATDDWVSANNFLKGERFTLMGEFLEKTNEDWTDLFLEDNNISTVRRVLERFNEKGVAFPNNGSVLSGPPGCLHGDTLIYDPVDGSNITVREREQLGKDFHVWAKNDQNQLVISKAEKPWKYEPAEMVKFTFESGRTITVTKGHRFWNGTSYVSSQQILQYLRQYDAYHLPTISEHVLSTRVSNVPHLNQTVANSLDGCHPFSYFYDEQLPQVRDIFQSVFPSQDGVRERDSFLHLDDQDNRYTHNHHSHRSFLPSNRDCTFQTGLLLGFANGLQPFSTACEHLRNLCPSLLRRGLVESQWNTEQQVHGHVLETTESSCDASYLEHNLGIFCEEPSLPLLAQSRTSHQSSIESGQIGSQQKAFVDRCCEELCSLCAPSIQSLEYCEHDCTEFHTFLLWPPSTDQTGNQRGRFSDCSYDSLIKGTGNRQSNDYTAIDKVVKAELVGTENYYDFHVPYYNNYWAEGFVHHNTGKTLASRIIMNKLKGTFIWVSARDFYNAGSFSGMTHAFDLAKELAPSVVCFEDCDNWMNERSVDFVKSEMDGIARYSGVWTILTTNFPERLPEALIDRPGRFHDVLQFALPTDEARKQMLLKWVPGISQGTLVKAISDTNDYSGAHLYHLAAFARSLKESEGIDINEAVKLAVQKVKDQKEIINGIQLEGARYRPRKAFLDVIQKQLNGRQS